MLVDPAIRSSAPVGPPGLTTTRFAAAPVEGGVGLVPTGFGRGRACLEVAATGGPGDFVRLAVGVDTALGISVHTGTPEPTAGPTVDLRIDRVAEPAPGNRLFVVEGDYRGHSAHAGTGTVVVRDGTGRTVALAVGTMVVEPRPADRPTGTAATAHLTGVAPLDPDELVEQVQRAATDDDRIRLTLSPSMANLRGTVHGGVVMALGRSAQDRFPGPPSTTLSTTVEYLRPLPPAGGTLTCRTHAVRAGRRFRTLHTELLLDDGRTAAVVTTTREVA